MSLDDWKPNVKHVFSDDEIVEALRKTPKEDDRRGNLWAFFSALPKPERERLERVAQSKE